MQVHACTYPQVHFIEIYTTATLKRKEENTLNIKTKHFQITSQTFIYIALKRTSFRGCNHMLSDEQWLSNAWPG